MIGRAGARKMVKPEEVFTPGMPAVENFVDRPELVRSVVDAFRTPGKQVVLYGETGGGKTSAAHYILSKKLQAAYVRVQCQPSYSLEDLICNVFREMERKFSVTTKTSQVGFAEMKRTHTGSLEIREAPTPKNLVEVCGRLHATALIDDYEKLGSKAVKTQAANLAKEFSDRAGELPGRLAIIGIHASPGEMIHLDESLDRRLVQIQVPMMTDADIRRIFTHGFATLGISCSTRIIGDLVALPGGYGSYAHDIGLKLARILNTKSGSEVSDLDVTTAIERLLVENEGRFGQVYQNRIQQSHSTRQLRQFTCEAMALTPKKELDVDEIHDTVEQLLRKWKGLGANVARSAVLGELTKLTQPKDGFPEILIRQGSTDNYTYRWRNLMFRTYVRWRYEKRIRGKLFTRKPREDTMNDGTSGSSAGPEGVTRI